MILVPLILGSPRMSSRSGHTLDKMAFGMIQLTRCQLNLLGSRKKIRTRHIPEFEEQNWQEVFSDLSVQYYKFLRGLLVQELRQ